MIVVVFPGVWYSHSCLFLKIGCKFSLRSWADEAFSRGENAPTFLHFTARLTWHTSDLRLLSEALHQWCSEVKTTVNTNFKILQAQVLELISVCGQWRRLNCTTGLILSTIYRQDKKNRQRAKPITWTENLAYYYGLFIRESSDHKSLW